MVMDDTAYITDEKFSYVVAGDFTIKLFINDMFFIKKLGKVSFNTAFLEQDQTEIVFNANEVDPEILLRKKKVPSTYKIILKIKKLCDCDNTKTPISLCSECKSFLEKNRTLLVWSKIMSLVNDYRTADQSSMNKAKNNLFGDIDEDDIDYVLSKANKINSTNKLSNINTQENDNKNNDMEIEKNYENSGEKEEEENYDDDNEESDDSYDESSEEEEEYEEEDNMKNFKRKKKKNLNDSFESECRIF